MIGGDGRAIAPPTGRPEVSSVEGRSKAPSVEHRSILLEPRRLARESRYGDAILREVAAEEDAPGSAVTVFDGFHRLAVRRFMGYYRQVVADAFGERWRGTSEGLIDFEKRLQVYRDGWQDLESGGRWWDRTWRQALVPEKGGAPLVPRIDVVGEEIELVRFGDIVLTNEGRVRFGKLSLYLDDDRIYEQIQKTTDSLVAQTPRARVDANVARVPNPKEKDKDKERDAKEAPRPIHFDERRLDVSVEIVDDARADLERVLKGTARDPGRLRRGRTPRGNVYTGDGWNLAGRPSLQLRMPGSEAISAVSSVALELNLNFFPGESRQLFAILSAKVRARPKNDEVVGTLELEVVRW